MLTKLQGVIKKKIEINVAFETEMEGRENVMKEMSVSLKAFSIHASGVCLYTRLGSIIIINVIFLPMASPFPFAS
jgi:hypothetical protein